MEKPKIIEGPVEAIPIGTRPALPHPDDYEKWPELPSVLGLEGCLERVRFAVDTAGSNFYFGSQ